MTNRISIHIGVDRLDPNHYPENTFPVLLSCKKDARDMAELAARDFDERVVLLDEEATVAAFTDAVLAAAERLNPVGGLLLLTFSGHGGQIKDADGREGDGLDETWCLFDRQLLDDELFDLWTMFGANVRIVVVSDSCNSGTVTGSIGLELTETLKAHLSLESADGGARDEVIVARAARTLELAETDAGALFGRQVKFVPERAKRLPDEANRAIDERHGPDYARIQRETRISLTRKKIARRVNDFRELLAASVILIAACQDWQITKAGRTADENSVFTAAFKEVWAAGAFRNYLELHARLWEKFAHPQNPSDIQHPNYYRVGPPDPAFELGRPFAG